jgi:glycosyltransferase involved in cell wall biosynthesis
MKIAQLVSNFYTTAADTNKGINSNAALLTDKLVDRNNDVTLFASSDSLTKAKLFSVAEGPTSQAEMSEGLRRSMLNLLISRCFAQADKFDIIHSHFTFGASFFSNLVNTPTIHSIHSPFDEDTKKILAHFKDQNYVSFSFAQRAQFPTLNWVANIYHGVDVSKFEFNPHPEPYVLFLGRLTEEKGAHLAIEAAQAAGVNLIIAGRSYPTENYWHTKIEKHIDGKKVRYVGEADFETKVELLKNASALLFPTQYHEAFGLVMIEAMACGTPVIATRKGSVPEVVKDRHTGYVVDDVAGMVKAIHSISKINREECRKRVRLLFSADAMVLGYEKVYMRLIEENRAKQKDQK